jgi:hypothetical protein
VGQLDNYWVASLSPDPDATTDRLQNRLTREVRSGHYVLVPPTPLPQPVLVATSREMAAELNLTEADLQQANAGAQAHAISTDLFAPWHLPLVPRDAL